MRKKDGIAVFIAVSRKAFKSPLAIKLTLGRLHFYSSGLSGRLSRRLFSCLPGRSSGHVPSITDGNFKTVNHKVGVFKSSYIKSSYIKSSHQNRSYFTEFISAVIIPVIFAEWNNPILQSIAHCEMQEIEQ